MADLRAAAQEIPLYVSLPIAIGIPCLFFILLLVACLRRCAYSEIDRNSALETEATGGYIGIFDPEPQSTSAASSTHSQAIASDSEDEDDNEVPESLLGPASERVGLLRTVGLSAMFPDRESGSSNNYGSLRGRPPMLGPFYAGRLDQAWHAVVNRNLRMGIAPSQGRAGGGGGGGGGESSRTSPTASSPRGRRCITLMEGETMRDGGDEDGTTDCSLLQYRMSGELERMAAPRVW